MQLIVQEEGILFVLSRSHLFTCCFMVEENRHNLIARHRLFLRAFLMIFKSTTLRKNGGKGYVRMKVCNTASGWAPQVRIVQFLYSEDQITKVIAMQE